MLLKSLGGRILSYILLHAKIRVPEGFRLTPMRASKRVVEVSLALNIRTMPGISHEDIQMRDCQKYGPFLNPYYNTGPNLGDPKRDHNFDNPPDDKYYDIP